MHGNMNVKLQALSEPDYTDSYTEGRTNTETIIWIRSSTSVAPRHWNTKSQMWIQITWPLIWFENN